MQKQKNLGTCGCGENLQEEYGGPDTTYICCPRSHNEPGHVCFVMEEEI